MGARRGGRGMNILEQISIAKRLEVEQLKITHPVSVLERQVTRGGGRFRDEITKDSSIAIIAEIKKASPSRGVIREDFQVDMLARAYARGGASAISVLTEQRCFLGKHEYLAIAKSASGLPILCKDFILDPYQITFAAAHGADAILLIARLLPQDQLVSFAALARERGLDPLVEVHTAEELRRALDCGADLIGVNNRDLTTFTVDLNLAERLAPLFPRSVTPICESGISSRADINRMAASGYRAFLVGESLIRSANPSDLLRELRGEK